jgi:hypothetical protein
MVLHDLAVRPEPPESEFARATLRAYLDDVVGRFHSRCLTADEFEAAELEFANDDLVPPRGVLLVAWLHDVRSGAPACGSARPRPARLFECLWTGNTGAAGSLEH